MNKSQYTRVYFRAQQANWTIRHMTQRTLKQILNELMERDGLNATSLAARLIEADPSVPEEERKNYQPTLWRILNNDSFYPKFQTLQLLAAHFGVTVSQLTGETPLLEDRQTQTVIHIMQELPAYKRKVLVSTALTLAESDEKTHNN